MSPLSDQEIAAARRVSVLEYFRTCLPRELIQVSAHDYRTKTHSSLVISDTVFCLLIEIDVHLGLFL